MAKRGAFSPLQRRIERERQGACKLVRQQLENEQELDTSKLRFGMKRSEMFDIFGQPDLQHGTTQAYRGTNSLYRYGRIVLIFEPWRGGGLYGAIEYDDAGQFKLSHLWSPTGKEKDGTATGQVPQAGNAAYAEPAHVGAGG